MKARKNYLRESYKTKEEWLKARGFGGSSAAAIIGKSPYMSKLELYKACITDSASREKNSDSMTYGTMLEPIVRKAFAYDYGDSYSVRAPKGHEMYRRADKPYLTATVDGILTDLSTGKRGVLEIKTHDFRNGADEDEWNGRVPDNYYIQMLHYMMVMDDMEFAILYAKLRYFRYDDEGSRTLDHSELRAYEPIRREDVADELRWLEAKETEFWEENIKKRKIPSDFLVFRE